MGAQHDPGVPPWVGEGDPEGELELKFKLDKLDSDIEFRACKLHIQYSFGDTSLT